MRNRATAYASVLWLAALALLLGACAQPEMPSAADMAEYCERAPRACQWERI